MRPVSPGRENDFMNDPQDDADEQKSYWREKHAGDELRAQEIARETEPTEETDEP